SVTGSQTLTLNDVPADFSGTITPGGAAVTVTITTAGQNGQLTFSGTATQQITVHITNNPLGTVTVTLRKPDGSQLTSSTSSSSSFNLATQTLPTTGTYTISIDPAGAATGSLSLNLEVPGTNLALNKTATQSSTAWGGTADRAVDGNTNGNWAAGSVTHTAVENQAWWHVDLGSVQSIATIDVWNRTDCCGSALTNFYVLVSDQPFTSTDLTTTLNQSGVWNFHNTGQAGTPTSVVVNRTGRYVRIQLAGVERISLAEVQVFQGQ
ncbi:MAG TPA: discoidin domain-containing protein, partial [Pyrinomonadaceae bacterium]|nr:discoidin domain-containing protein [Pyrinomonadaceae bacterium]